MPQITVEGYGSFEVPAGARLVNALEQNGVDILHRCGGYARCTTCRVVFSAGEPARMTRAEYNKLDCRICSARRVSPARSRSSAT